MKAHAEFLITADAILTGKGLERGLALGVKNGCIDKIDDSSRFHRDRKLLDCTGYRITPCFCDYHLHFFKQNHGKIDKIIDRIISHGITGAYEGGDPQLYGRRIREHARGRLDIKTTGSALYKKGTYGEYIGKDISNAEEVKAVIDGLSRDGVDYVKG